MLLGILGACGNKKTNIDPFASITKEVDSIRRIADSIHCDESPEDPQPIQADESFDDFIYNFASDDVLQRQRVKFPLSEEEIDKKLTAYFATHPVLTRSNMQSLCSFTQSMASRQIRRLKAKGNLQNIGKPTQPIYIPTPGHYEK